MKLFAICWHIFTAMLGFITIAWCLNNPLPVTPVIAGTASLTIYYSYREFIRWIKLDRKNDHVS